MGPGQYPNKFWLISNRICGNHVRAISREELKISICKVNVTITAALPKGQWIPHIAETQAVVAQKKIEIRASRFTS